MTHLVFQLGRHFPKRILETGWLKNWIVTKASWSAGRIDNLAFNQALESSEDSSRPRQRDNAAKTRRSLRHVF